ncbi:MAG: hypothetical protein ABJP66_11950 [Hyphomicrobiales bacterium]
MRQRKERIEAIVDWLTIDTIDRATEAELTDPGRGLELIISEMECQVIDA